MWKSSNKAWLAELAAQIQHVVDGPAEIEQLVAKIPVVRNIYDKAEEIEVLYRELPIRSGENETMLENPRIGGTHPFC